MKTKQRLTVPGPLRTSTHWIVLKGADCLPITRYSSRSGAIANLGFRLLVATASQGDTPRKPIKVADTGIVTNPRVSTLTGPADPNDFFERSNRRPSRKTPTRTTS